MWRLTRMAAANIVRKDPMTAEDPIIPSARPHLISGFWRLDATNAATRCRGGMPQE